jgi:amidase
LTGVSYLPSTVVPVCLDPHGISIGLAVVGPYLGDLTTLALAGRLSGLLPPLGPPPLEPVRLPAAPDGCATTTAAVRPSPHTTGDPSTCPTKSN